MAGHRFRLLLVAAVVVAACLVLFCPLWYLRIDQQESGADKQSVASSVRQRAPGVRGRILDFNGVELARNGTNMEIGLDLAAVEAAWKEREKSKVTPNPSIP